MPPSKTSPKGIHFEKWFNGIPVAELKAELRRLYELSTPQDFPEPPPPPPPPPPPVVTPPKRRITYEIDALSSQAGGIEWGWFEIHPGFWLYEAATTSPMRLRLYGTQEARTLDSNRLPSEQPHPDIRGLVILDVVLPTDSGLLRLPLHQAFGYNLEKPKENRVWYALTKYTVSPPKVELTFQPLEDK